MYNNINFLIGNKDFSNKPFKPFDKVIIEFLDQLSKKLKKYSEYPDLIALSFWLRKKNLEKIKLEKNLEFNIQGLGLLFHITPSNVPTNFFYSLSFGLLTGNSNIVKVPSKKFSQIDIIINLLNELMKMKNFNFLEKKINIIQYDNNRDINDYFSAICNKRIIWGSENTINNIRNSKLSSNSSDLIFADKYSFCMIDSNKILKLNDSDLKYLFKKFYNDSYDVDQNACSSPQIIFWIGSNVEKAQQKFWNGLSDYISQKNYINNSNAVEKYKELVLNLINYGPFKNIKFWKNNIYTIQICKNLKQEYRSKFGIFFEYRLKNLKDIFVFVNKKIQTITYFGIEKDDFKKLVSENILLGVDRIVPIGRALDIGFIWDGHDICRQLTRKIDLL
jgi:hypothetical protein